MKVVGLEVWVEDLQVEIIKGAIFGRKLFQKVIFFHLYCKICGKKGFGPH